MDIPLNLPAGEKLQNFLDYLNAGIRERVSTFGGSSGFADGCYETVLSGRFSFDQGELDLALMLKYSQNGDLEKIVADADETTTDIEDWQSVVHGFIHSIWGAAFSEREQKVFHRSFFCYVGEALDGEYWLQNKKVRFAPVIPDDKYPRSLQYERVVCIDQVVSAIDANHGSALAQERANKMAARLSLLLNEALYPPESTHRWVLDPGAEGDSVSKRCQLLFVHPSASCKEMPEKGQLCPPGKGESSITDPIRMAWKPLSLPKETRKILRAMWEATPEVAEAFDRAARLFQVGARCGRFYPSVGLAYRVAAVEAICKTEGEICDFTPFMRKYVGDSPELIDLYDFMYGKLRSSHFHVGEFHTGEFNRQTLLDPFQDAQTDYMKRMLRKCFWLLRVAKVNWMLSKLPEQ